MSYSNLFEPKYISKDPILDGYSKMKTNLWKRQISGGTDSGIKPYNCCFHLQGQVLAFYDITPKTEQVPSSIISIADISEVKETTIGVEDFLSLKVLNEEIGLRFESSAIRIEWMQIINALSQYFSKGSLPLSMKEFKDELTPYIRVKIEAELEARSFEFIKKHFNYETFCYDKGLSALLDISPKILKNRLIIGQCKFDGKFLPAEFINQKKLEAKQNAESLDQQTFSYESLYGKDFNVLLICQKPGANIDQTTIPGDYEFLKNELLPKALEFNSLFFYSRDSFNEAAVDKILPTK